MTDKLIEDESAVESPEKPPVIARIKARHLLALECARGVDDPRFYLNGINVKPHPDLPGVLLAATNGHMCVMMYDEHGYASREFIIETSKPLINSCKVKGLADASEWVEVHHNLVSVVKHTKYDEGDPMGMPAVAPPNAEFTNGIFEFKEISGDFPDVYAKVTPDLNEYNGLENGFISLNPDYLSKIKKAFCLALCRKDLGLELLFKSSEDPVYIYTSVMTSVVAILMPRRESLVEKTLPEFLEFTKDINDEK